MLCNRYWLRFFLMGNEFLSLAARFLGAAISVLIFYLMNISKSGVVNAVKTIWNARYRSTRQNHSNCRYVIMPHWPFSPPDSASEFRLLVTAIFYKPFSSTKRRFYTKRASEHSSTSCIRNAPLLKPPINFLVESFCRISPLLGTRSLENCLCFPSVRFSCQSSDIQVTGFTSNSSPDGREKNAQRTQKPKIRRPSEPNKWKRPPKKSPNLGAPHPTKAKLMTVKAENA